MLYARRVAGSVILFTMKIVIDRCNFNRLPFLVSDIIRKEQDLTTPHCTNAVFAYKLPHTITKEVRLYTIMIVVMYHASSDEV